MRLRDTLTAALVAVIIAVSVFVVGSAFRWTQAVIASLSAIAILLLVTSKRGLAKVSPLIATLGGALALTALQLAPLPNGLLVMLEPAGATLRSEGAALAHTSPWSGLTLDAPGSLRAACFFLILLAVACLGLRIAVTEKGRFRLLACVAAVCGITAVIVAVHVMVGATALYGLYTPIGAKPSVLGPLLNENHLGGLMAIGATVSIALTMYRRQASWLRVAWCLNAAACGATAVTSQSRGATLALLAGAAITAGILVAQRLFGHEAKRPYTREQFVTTSLPIGIVAVSAIVVIVYASAGAVSGQLARTTLAEIHQPKSKFAVWGSTIELVEESPWVGVGRGGFEPAFTRLHPAAAVASFSHVENEYLQAVVDWGIPGALVLGIGMLWVLSAGVRRWRDGPLIAGALGAVATIGLQSTVDFGIELLGIAIPVTAILATFSYVPLKPLDGKMLRLARPLRIALAAGLVAAVGLLFSVHTRSVQDDHLALADGATSIDEIRDSIERHPLDYFGFARAAELHMADDLALAVSELNHALRLHPTHPGLHHLAARMLFRAGHRDQAAIEYAMAIRNTGQPRPLLVEVVARLGADAPSAIPLDIVDRDQILNVLLELHHPEIAAAWLRRLLDRRPDDRAACEWLFAAAVHDQSLEEAQIADQRCTASESSSTRIGLGALLLRNRLYDEASKALGDVEAWPGRVDEKVTGWLISCDLSIARERWEDAKRCLRKLDATGFVAAERRQEISSRLEQIEAAVVARPDGQR